MDLNEKAMQTIKGWQDEQNLELISRINILEDATDLLIDPDFSTLSDTERLSLIANAAKRTFNPKERMMLWIKMN